MIADIEQRIETIERDMQEIVTELLEVGSPQSELAARRIENAIDHLREARDISTQDVLHQTEFSIRDATPEEYQEIETAANDGTGPRIVWACVIDGSSVAHRFTELLKVGTDSYIGIDGTEDDWHIGVSLPAEIRAITVKVEDRA